MAKTKIVLFSDPVNHEKDVIELKKILFELNSFKPEDFSILHTDNPSMVKSLLSPGCTCFIDYGGLRTAYGNAIYNEFERIAFELIENNPSVNFIILCTMGKEYYDKTLFDYPNVHYIDNDDSYTKYEKYLIARMKNYDI